MLYEFPKEYSYETLSATGSGIHLYKDVTFSFDFEDRLGNAANTFSEITQNPSIGDMSISVLDISGSVIYENFYSGNAIKSFTFTEQNNIDVFGSYQKDFGVIAKVKDNTASIFELTFYVFANPPVFESVQILDGLGIYSYSGESGLQRTVNTGVAASVVYDPPSTSNAKILYTAVNVGTFGNSIQVDYDPPAGNTEVDINLVGYIINILIPAGGTTTLQQIIDEVNSNPSSSGLVFASAVDNPANLLTGGAAAPVFLTGGQEPPEIATGRLSVDVSFLNDPSYTRFSFVEVYTGSSENVEIGEGSFYGRVPVFTQAPKAGFNIRNIL